MPRIIVFDVNETLLDLAALDPYFERAFGDTTARKEWFAEMLRTAFVSRVPANPIGDAAIQSLRKFGVDTAHVVRGGDRLGIYFLETGAAQRGSLVVYDRARSAVAEIEPGMVPWKEVFAGGGWFHWTGITPAISAGAADVVAEALDAAREAGVTVSCDLNFRAKLWKWGKTAGEVMPDLVAQTDVIIEKAELVEPAAQ